MSRVNLIPKKDLDTFITIVANAYPEIPLSKEEERARLKKRLINLQKDEKRHLYGLYRNGTLLGGMILYDFTMNFLSIKTLAGGVGLVAVDLVHKREKVCKELITYFLDHYRKKGAFIACLYPFRPDFYKKMGFGFGSKMHYYRIRPDQLPKEKKDHIQFLEPCDRKAVAECYKSYAEKRHGMIDLQEFELDRIIGNPDIKIVGYKENDRIKGYIAFAFKKGDEENFLINDILVKVFIYEDKNVLSELLTFLHDQKDQIRHIIITTQDDYFHHLLSDPRDSSHHLIPDVYHQSNASGVGLMYRVIDTESMFSALKDYHFGGQDCAVKFSICDSFFPENNRSVVVHFENGTPVLDGDRYDVEVDLDISEFSSLVMGVVPFKALYRYSLVHISDPDYVDVIHDIFQTEPPVCTTDF
jgi:predicted acetyltransferase